MTSRNNKSIWIAAFFLSCAVFIPIAGAHDVPIEPVLATITLNPTELKVHLDSDASYWLGEVLGVSEHLPARHWPEVYENLAKAYIAQHFQLWVDSQPLTANRVDCLFQAEPLSANKSRVLFDVTYSWPSLPLSDAALLKGKIDFFSEESTHSSNEDITEAREGKLLTHVVFRGQTSATLDVPLASPYFSIPLKNQIRSIAQIRQDRLVEGTKTALVSSWFWLFWMGVVLIVLRKKLAPYGVMAGGFLMVVSVVQAVLAFIKQ